MREPPIITRLSQITPKAQRELEMWLEPWFRTKAITQIGKTIENFSGIFFNRPNNTIPVRYLDVTATAPDPDGNALKVTTESGLSGGSSGDALYGFPTDDSDRYLGALDGDVVIGVGYSGNRTVYLRYTNDIRDGSYLRAALDAGTVNCDAVATPALATNPPASFASTLALGTAYQNIEGQDILLVVNVNITVNAGGSLLLGVGPTSTPTQQTIESGLTALGPLMVPIYLPSGYYALLSASGLTASIAGQIAMPV